jgi:hypothetical protein
MISDLSRAAVEGMSDLSGSGNGRREMYKDVIASILSLILSIIVIGFVGKFLWNETVARVFTVVRPVQSAWQIIGLMLLVSLFK